VTSFTRTFTWDGGSTITVGDVVTLTAPKAAAWHLQSDMPFQGSGDRYSIGSGGEPLLRIFFASPKGLTVTTTAATVKAPGPPGSIEQGVDEPRGYVLRAVAPAAVTFRFDVTLEMRDQRR
jgi:hypothetical protein